MKIGIFIPKDEPFSMRIYREGIINELSLLGIDVILNPDIKQMSDDVDLFWDHMAIAGNPPRKWLWKSEKPSVVTLHGARPFVLAGNEFWPTIKSRLKGKLLNAKKRINWASIDKSKFSYIAVSSHTKNEFVKTFRIPESRIIVIFHGVNHNIFYRSDKSKRVQAPYLFHVSQYQPAKNIDRIIAAYTLIPINIRPKFIVVASGYGYKPFISKSIPGLDFRTQPIGENELADLYCGAIGFIFPSLHEGFGMPILEAMACGCPVITSNVTACPEVAGDAALLVNPRSVEDIANSMIRLITDSKLREMLSNKGIQRASMFSWRKSAEAHFSVFQEAILK